MTDKQGITRFRGKDAKGFFESGTMSVPEFDAEEHGDDWLERRAQMAG